VRAVSIALVSVLCAAMISPASADNDKNKGQGQGRDNPNMGRGAGAGPQGQQIVIYDRDRDTVRSWYRNEYAAGRCPPGLAKKNNGCLPPGQAKRMWNMGEPLPRQVAYYPLPRELYAQLTPPPYGYQYVRVDNDILLMVIATRLIAGVLGNLGSFN
jgi:Ni/Co efflux regulator RcnB